MVVFEGGAPKKSDYRRFNVRGDDRGRARRLRRDGGGARRGAWRTGRPSRTSAPTTPSATSRSRRCRASSSSTAARGSSSAGLRALEGFRERGVAVISLAKRIEEVFLPGRRDAARARARHARAAAAAARARRGAPLRDHPPPHAPRQAMTESVLDGLPGVGPARKRALLKHFGSPEAVLGASREELEAVPGLPGEDRRASCTRTCTARRVTGRDPTTVTAARPARSRGVTGADRRAPRATVEPRGPRGHHRLLRRRQVDGDGRLRGRRLLLRRQPAAGDDPRRSSSCSCTRARRSSARRSSPTCAAASSSTRCATCSTTCARTACATACCSSTPTSETLLGRYKETRRRHPLAPDGLGRARHRRRARAAGAVARARRPRASTRAGISARDAAPPDRRRAAAAPGARQARASRSPRSASSTGPPRDADLVFDVRFLPNPHCEPTLRPLTGRDPRVVEYIDARRQARRVLRAPPPAARLPAARSTSPRARRT